jgi:hypothetical protein
MRVGIPRTAAVFYGIAQAEHRRRATAAIPGRLRLRGSLAAPALPATIDGFLPLQSRIGLLHYLS